jgi:biofilm PGA synthesis N-glycosyltransferase PgaC
MNYVLITPARNEEALVTGTLESVIAQTKRPIRWVIVDDGSTDRMADIVESYAKRHPWIELVRLPRRVNRNFAGKAHAFSAGLERVRSLQFDLIGNIDADITFGPDHFEFLLERFSEDPALGVAGTAYTQPNWDSMRDSFEGETSVHGACQLFRYQCFQEIGGYVANPAGGIDWIAVTTARMKGWRTRNFPDRRFQHRRVMGTAERSTLGAMFDYGAKDYFLGNSPVWELCRVVYRMGKRPVLSGGMALLCGYCWAAVRRVERPVPPELVRFHRGEQMKRLKTILSSVRRFKVEKYYLDPNREKPR